MWLIPPSLKELMHKFVAEDTQAASLKIHCEEFRGSVTFNFEDLIDTIDKLSAPV